MQGLDITTIIFIALAVFVLFKLRSVLGTRNGNERPPFNPFEERKPAPPSNDVKPQNQAEANKAPVDQNGNIISMPMARGENALQDAAAKLLGIITTDAPAYPGLLAIQQNEPSFMAKEFLQGARSAYEMIVLAFARGDKAALKPLLSPDVYQGFAAAITDREGRGESVESSFVSIDKADYYDAVLNGNQATITIRFVSKLINATKNREGAIISGDPAKVSDLVDIWSFSRALNARDPNWLLVATESAH